MMHPVKIDRFSKDSRVTTPAYDRAIEALPGIGFGCLLNAGEAGAVRTVEACERDPAPLLSAFYENNGLLILRDMHEISRQPGLLVRLSRLFGSEVENYRATITSDQFFHDSVDEILVLSNLPPCNYEPPPKPDPPRTDAGGLPISFPHRRGWHTDQSYRRPPPDITLLLGLDCPPGDQGQTLYADGISAYRGLPEVLKNRLGGLKGIHALRWTGRSRTEVKAGAPIKPLLPHQSPQQHPVVRKHPETGQLALYLCDDEQMDFVAGPFTDIGPGPDGEGDQLLSQLLTHLTRRNNVYVHKWEPGDLVIHDNRNMLHTATWYDSANHPRLMWRTTVMGNPGREYAGEPKSWIPSAGAQPMQGLEDLKF